MQYEPVISDGSRSIVHHLEVFHCWTDAGKKIPLYSGPGEAENKPPFLKPCSHVLGAWAMGADVRKQILSVYILRQKRALRELLTKIAQTDNQIKINFGFKRQIQLNQKSLN